MKRIINPNTFKTSMQIKDMGGEFELIRKLVRNIKNKSLVKGIGDDTAVIKQANKDSYLLFTTDMLIEDIHFKKTWSPPQQIGRKAMEVNASDIGAMGGKPTYALVAIGVPKNIPFSYIKKMYDGLYQSAKKHNCLLIGGDTVQSKKITLCISMLGEVPKKCLCLRSHAKPGDLIMISGCTGRSSAGLQLLVQNKTIKPAKDHKKLLAYHLDPQAHYKKVDKFLSYLNALEDVSDGIATEIHNICFESKVGAIIEKNKIPVCALTKKAAKVLKKDPVDFALFGGEDFELVFTIPPKHFSKVKGKVIGKITKQNGIFLLDKNRKRDLPRKGYDHFA